ncbi:hypothetical protein ABIA33_007106 [Streptacidiphilus sp. MAP12-16]
MPASTPIFNCNGNTLATTYLGPSVPLMARHPGQKLDAYMRIRNRQARL